MAINRTKASLISATAAGGVLAAAVGLSSFFNDSSNDNTPPTDVPTVVETIEAPVEKGNITSFEILQQYFDTSEDRKRMLLLNPDGPHGMFHVNEENGSPETNRGHAYKQLMRLADQLVEDEVPQPERILSAIEASLQGENPFIQPHTVHPHGDEDHHHYTLVTPFPVSITSHWIESATSSVNDPTFLILSPYSSLSTEVFVGFHEMGHALDFMIAKEKNGPVSHRKRLMYEATADCFAMLLYERAGLDYPNHLDGLGGDFMQRVSDMRTMAEFHMIMNSADSGGTKQYFNHPFLDSFRKIAQEVRTDGTLAEMSVEDMLIMAQDHVFSIADKVITEEYVSDVTTTIVQDRAELYALPFLEQADEIRSRLDEGRYEGPAREFYERYLKAAERTAAVQPKTKAEMLAAWESRFLHEDEHEVDFDKAWSLEVDLMSRQLNSLYSKVNWERERNGHEAAHKLFSRLMYGKEGSEELGLYDRLIRLAEIGKEREHKHKVKSTELKDAPPSIVSMETVEAIKLLSEQMLGDEFAGRVAIVDTTELFSLNEKNGLQFDPHKSSPALLAQLKAQMAEDQTDKVPYVIGSLKQGMAQYFTRQLNTDRMVQTIFWADQDQELEGDEKPHTYAAVCVMPDVMSTHQIEQRLLLSNDPDAIWVSPLETKTLQVFLAARELAVVRSMLDEDAEGAVEMSPQYIHQWQYRNAMLDCFAILAAHKAYAENPRALEHPSGLANRIADLRDFGLLTAMAQGDNTAVLYDTAPYIRDAEGFILHAFTLEELREKSFDELAEKMAEFIEKQKMERPPVVLSNSYKELQQKVAGEWSFFADPTKGFLERRDILSMDVMPSIHDTSTSAYTVDILNRMNTAAWKVAPNLSPREIAMLWQREMTEDADLTRDKRLLKVVFEADWLQEQQQRQHAARQKAAANPLAALLSGVSQAPSTPSITPPVILPPSINGGGTVEDNENTETARPLRSPALTVEERLRALGGLAGQLQADNIEYSAEEARHILQTYLKEVMINIQGRFVKVKIEPEMIGRSGFDITIPPGTISGVQVPVQVIVTPEYVASLDPNFEKKQQEAVEKDNVNRMIQLPLPSGRTINILVTSDMISEDGTFITLQPDQVPAELGPADEPMKIFVPRQVLEEARKLAEAQENEKKGVPDTDDNKTAEKDDPQTTQPPSTPTPGGPAADTGQPDKQPSPAQPPSAQDNDPQTAPPQAPKKPSAPTPPPIPASFRL